MEWNVFICHAGEDKETVARPLTELLERAGLKVWLDTNELTLGDSLNRKIDDGLARSEYGIVILSEHFFRKRWPPHELAGLAAKQLIDGRKVILPVWHGVDQSFIVKYSPPLADAVAVSTSDGLEKVAVDILKVVRAPLSNPASQKPRIASSRKKRMWWIVFAATALPLIAAGIGSVYVAHKSALNEETREWQQDSSRALFQRFNHEPISGYFVVSCNTCDRPRAWAFYLPRSAHGMPEHVPALDSVTRKTTSWPMVEFLYPEDKPEIGSCVEFPTGVCQKESYQWSPRHRLTRAKSTGPALRLQLRVPFSGFELSVSNESRVLAQGIIVDGMAWQSGAPGAEFKKSYRLHDLSSLADTTIFRVFDESDTGDNKSIPQDPE